MAGDRAAVPGVVVCNDGVSGTYAERRAARWAGAKYSVIRALRPAHAAWGIPITPTDEAG